MRRNFDELQRFLETAYPELDSHIAGEIYPPPHWVALSSQVVWFLQISSLYLALFGDAGLRFFGLAELNFFRLICAHKWKVVGFLFILSSFMESFKATGAFEVYIDGELVLSRLQSKMFPSRNDILIAFGERGFSTDMF
jgi:selT/selW/selH-like putative selenoprotein